MAAETSTGGEIGLTSRYPEPDSPKAQPPASRSHPTDNNPTSSAGGEVRISEARLSEAMEQLRDAVATRDSESRTPTIYRVPDELVKYGGDRKDYDPIAVYLGGFGRLFAHDQYTRKLRKLKAYKWCCVRQLIGRNNSRQLLSDCMKSMDGLLPRVRASYYEEINVDDVELAQMMLLDGCFILHHLLKYTRPAQREDYDRTHRFVWQFVARDLLLLENQIPFFVVKKLFIQLRNDGEHEKLLFTGSLSLFRSLGLKMQNLSQQERNNDNLSIPAAEPLTQVEDPHHLLHLFYLSVGCPRQSQSAPVPDHREEVLRWIPCAKELEEAGVRFRKGGNATSFLNIKFDYRRGVLEIPPLHLYDSSSAVFRNLIAFEQAYPDTQRDISTYASFMDCLVKTPEDMRILHLRDILVNQMSGEQDTSRFFSRICAWVHLPADNYLVTIMDDVSKYKNSRRHKWREALVRNYFRNPWLAMSVLAAVLLLGLTVLQTFFTVYPYYKPSN